MSKRQARSLAVVVGVIALTSACTYVNGQDQSDDTPRPIGTSETDAPYVAPRSEEPVADDPSQLYDFFNPCDLIPLPKIREITRKGLLFENKRHGQSKLTSNVGDARNWNNPQLSYPFCTLSDKADSAKAVFDMGVGTKVSKQQFWAGVKSGNGQVVGSSFVERLSRAELPGAAQAYVLYSKSPGGKRYSYTQVFARTEHGMVLAIVYPTYKKADLLKLAEQGLITLNGKRYKNTK